MSWGFLRSKEGDRSEFSHLTSLLQIQVLEDRESQNLTGCRLLIPIQASGASLPTLPLESLVKRVLIRRHSDGLFPSDLLTWCYIAIADSWSDDLRNNNQERDGETKRYSVEAATNDISGSTERNQIRGANACTMLPSSYCTEHRSVQALNTTSCSLVHPSVTWFHLFEFWRHLLNAVLERPVCFKIYTEFIFIHSWNMIPQKRFNFWLWEQHQSACGDSLWIGKRSRRLLVTRS